MFSYFPIAGNNWKKKREKIKRKKNGAEPEMGYCPFEHWLSAGCAGSRCWEQAQAGRAGRQALGTGAGGACRQEGLARRPGRGLGVLLGQQAMHSVHSACFDPVSTQYCS